MGKRKEIIETNCPACGCGLQVDLDSLDTMAVGDRIEKPEKPATPQGGDDPAANSQNESSTGDKDPETPNPAGSNPAGADSGEGSGDDPAKPANQEPSGLGDW